MAKSDDAQEVNRQDGSVKKARRFDERDFKTIAEYVIEEEKKRREARRDKERAWTEIDRQIAMNPEVAFKKLPDGTIDPKKAWMAEVELPLQAQALEVLADDAGRMLFADGGQWFRAHAEVTDDYLQKVDFKSFVLGDKNFVPSTVNQDNADKLVEGFLNHYFRQYDHSSRFDIINSEAFKYGIGVGRGRLETKNVFINESRGVRSEKQMIPVIVPCSIKNLYLEEPKPSLHSSTVLGPAHIAVDNIKYESLALAARKGSTDPDDEDGGWMPKAFKEIIPEKNGYVKVLEMEGDLVVPRKTVRSVVIPGAIVTVAVGGTEKGGTVTKAVIRFRFRKYPFSSYLLFPYFQESADDAYASSPLMKGRSVQMTATDAVNRFLDGAMLKTLSPISYDRNDMQFAQEGGPSIFPGAQWGTMDPIKVHSEIGGDPTALSNAALQFINLYSQLTGVLPARLGAQSISHTTAFSKQQELQRGAVRTVKYVDKIGNGPITRWLDMAYTLGLSALKRNQEITFYIPQYGGYVRITKDMLPERVEFEWFGANGPQEKQQRVQQRIQSLMMAFKLDGEMNVKLQRPPRLNVNAAIDAILRDGGWVDIDEITNDTGQPGASSPPPAPPPPPGVQGADGGGGMPSPPQV